jgi:hypothetical protein
MLEKPKLELAGEALVNLTALEEKLLQEGAPESDQDVTEVQNCKTTLRIMRKGWISHSREEITGAPDEER